MKAKKVPNDIDEYIARFEPEVQELLQTIRVTIRKAAPEAEEAIAYQIPTFKLNGNLVFFAGYQKHIALYPAPRGHEAFKDELSRFNGGKGTVQFPLDEPLPLPLIRRIVRFRVQENLKKAKTKTAKSGTPR